MKQGVEKQCLFDAGEAQFPIDKSIFRNIKGSTRGIESESIGSGLYHLNDKAQRFFYAGKKGIAGLGKVPTTVGAIMDCPQTIINRFISGVFLFFDIYKWDKR